ncbi:Choline transport protein 1 [Colletotrichum chlorophyti]|uniref:Choline transport protein 1 n=1 Tax=Colletotrichum chlorophyti TaxID=708187 RepID=A0A1Q8RUL9_9PEZI|nr:Choline transport protein 1 [Colletotrichum chlorophyti]
MTQDFSVFLSLGGFLVITHALMKNKTAPVFGPPSSTRRGGLQKGIVFLTGLLNPNFIYSGLDGAIHLAEECTHAATTIPRALVSTIVIGFVTASVFSVAMLYSFTDY